MTDNEPIACGEHCDVGTLSEKRVQRAGWVLVIALTASLGAGAARADILLEADFDNQLLDAPVGTGGAAVGEPVSFGAQITAIVRAAPFTTPSLEITDNSSGSAGSVGFELLGSAEVTSGVMSINAKLWFDSLDKYFLYVREQGSSSDSFLSMTFGATGSISARDEDTSTGVVIGSYDTGRLFPISLVYDMDANTYDIYLDGSLALENEPHGVVGSGVGTVYFGIGYDEDLTGRYYVDDISVCEGDYPTAVDENGCYFWRIFSDGFEGGDTSVEMNASSD